MARYIFLILFFSTSFFASSSPLSKDELSAVYSLMGNDPDSAYTLSYKLLDGCNDNEDYFGLVKLNFVLGYLHQADGNIGKSVLHYLEAVRYSDIANYEGLQKDAISVRKNLANLYRKYKAHDLATSYYNEALEIADWTDNKKQLTSLKFNLALTYKQNNQNDEAISTFKEIISVSSESRKKRILNELGLIYKNDGDLENAKFYFNQLLDLAEKHKLYSAKASHNLGQIEYELGNLDDAIKLTNRSIQLKEEIEDVDQRSLFISYKALGDYLFEAKKFVNATKAYQSAEALIGKVRNESSSFELYRSLSQLNYEIGETGIARKYSSLYSKRVDEYIATQQTLQETDRQYNMDLITKRYLDQVAKQEQIASILLYSKVISGSLLALLLLTIGYNWYQKVQLRKSIIQDLIKLKVVE